MEDLLAHQQQAELSKLPLFFGSRDKDNFTAEQWVERVERSKASARWNDVQTMAAVYNAIRGKALKWFECLKRSPVDPNVWEDFKGAFLASYSTTRTSRTTTLHLADLRQGPNEPVVDFYPRVESVISDIESLAPAHFEPPATPFPAEITGLQGYAGVPNAVKEAAINRLTKAGAAAAFNLMGLHIFIAGLKPFIRAEMMKAPPADMYAAFMQATKLEKIAAEPHRQGAASQQSVYEVEAEPPMLAPASPGLDGSNVEAECAALAAKIKMLRRKAKPSGKPAGAPKTTKHSTGGPSDDYNRCRYCKQLGHLQARCFSRIKAGAPMVDKEGKPFQQAVNQIGGQPPTPASAGQQQHQQQLGQVTYPPPTYNPFAHMMTGEQVEGIAWAGPTHAEPLNY